MATLSMLLVIIGGGGLLLGIAWCVQSGFIATNIKPAAAGVVLLSAGLLLPLGDSGTNMSPDAPPTHQPPPPGMEAPGPPPPQQAQPTQRSLNLSVGPSITTRVRFACSTDGEGKASCWGEPVPLPDEPVHSIALGREHGCALMQTGELKCWGEAQLEASRLSAFRFVDIAASLETVCGITGQGALHCFGADLGMPPPGRRWAQITGGASHMCALDHDGLAFCWGQNQEGQLDVPQDTILREISAGHFHTCGVDPQQQIVCWGRNNEGQSDPPAVSGLKHVSAGWAHSCALTASGQAVCWGCKGRHRALMHGAEEACSPPKATFSDVSAGDLWRSCGITPNGEAICWGGLTRIGGPS